MLEWNGTSFLEMMEAKVAANVARAAAQVRDAVKEAVGIQGTPQIRSKPGEPPRRQTGNLQTNVVSYQDEGTPTVSYIQSHATTPQGFDYAYELEMFMDRPHLRSTFDEMGNEILATVGGK